MEIKLITKETLVIVEKKPLGFIDNGEYSIKYTWKLFGIIPIKKQIKK